MSTRWHDLIIDRLPDGGIHLEQQSGVDDPNVIHLHPEQVIFIARQLCGMKPEKAEQVADLERRIGVLTDKLQHIVCATWFREEVLERCGSGLEIMAKLNALLDLALEFDGCRLEPEYKPEPDERKVRQARTGTLPSTQPSASKDNAPQRMETAGGPNVGQLHIAGL